MLDELMYFVTEAQFTQLDTSELLSTPSLAYLIRCSDEDVDIDEVMLNFVYGEMMSPPGSPDSPADRLINHVELTPQIERKVSSSKVPNSVPNCFYVVYQARSSFAGRLARALSSRYHSDRYFER